MLVLLCIKRIVQSAQYLQTEAYLGCCSLSHTLHAAHHVVKEVQVVGGEHLGQAGPQVIHMVPLDTAHSCEVCRHLLHHVTVAQARHLPALPARRS